MWVFSLPSSARHPIQKDLLRSIAVMVKRERGGDRAISLHCPKIPPAPNVKVFPGLLDGLTQTLDATQGKQNQLSSFYNHFNADICLP